jgi:hypothetical protein
VIVHGYTFSAAAHPSLGLKPVSHRSSAELVNDNARIGRAAGASANRLHIE